jgi:hypothetical protein
MPAKMRFVWEICNIPQTMVNVWDCVQHQPAELDPIREAEPAMQTKLIDILNHPPNKVLPKEITLLQKIDRLYPELQSLLSIPAHSAQLKKMKQWAEDFVTSINKERCIYVAKPTDRMKTSYIDNPSPVEPPVIPWIGQVNKGESTNQILS